MDVRSRRHGMHVHLHDVRARSCSDIMKLTTFLRGVFLGGIIFLAIIYIGAILGGK